MKAALVCIAKNEDRYIQEWLEYHLKLGFTTAYVYENNWKSNIHMDNVTTIPFNGEQCQFQAYNHWMEMYSKSYDWVAFIDVDEFITLKQHINITDFLNQYKEFNGVYLNWVMFVSITDKPNESGVIDRFLYRECVQNHHLKYILNINNRYTPLIDHPHFPRNIELVDTHYQVIVNTPFHTLPNIDIAQINHYYYKTEQEFIQKCNNGRADVVGIRPLTNWQQQSTVIEKDMTAYNFFHNH